MKTSKELEIELQHARRVEYEQKRLAELKRKEEFRKNTDVDIYTSDDYCGLKSGEYSFYYGYEVTENEEWCFEAEVSGKKIMKIRSSELWHDANDEPFFFLLAGIARFLKEKH